MPPQLSSPRRPPKARENDPPGLKSHGQGKLKSLSSRLRSSVSDSSRRRRARTTGDTRFNVGQAKQRRIRIKSVSNIVRFNVAARARRRGGDADTDAGVEEAPPELPSSPAPITTMPVTLPRFLERPVFREVNMEVLAAIDPELKNVHVDYILEGLEHLGPQMLQVLTGIQADPVKNTLPKELGILVNDLSSDAPTHMLALYSRTSPANANPPTPRRSVTLFPTHNIILAAHCANLPRLPPPDAIPPKKSGDKITVPVVPLCIPSPQTFPQLSAYLYTKNTISFLTSLFSVRPPLSLTLDDERTVQQFAGKLAGTYTTQALLHQIMMVNGHWRNACALGVYEEGLWGAMDLAWETLLTALAIATGNTQAMMGSS